MRELTRSMLSFSWVMSLFGVKQATNLLRPSEAASSFDVVAEAAEGELPDAIKQLFAVGDNLQKAATDLTFGVFSVEAFNPGRWLRTTSKVVQESAEALGRSVRCAGSGAQRTSGPGPK